MKSKSSQPKRSRGRPRKDAAGVVEKISVDVPPRVVEFLRRVGDGSAYRGARLILERAAEGEFGTSQ